MNREQLSEEFFTGINYWGSESAINMWENFNPESIENDLRLLRDAGITHLRVFSLWPIFQPLTALYGPDDVYEYSFGEKVLPDTPAGRAGVSEEAIEKFAVFCGIAKKYGMSVIAALITGHMSFRTYCPPAFSGKALLSDPTVLKWQVRFVKYFCERFKDEEAIVGWDLGNEPIHMPGLKENPDAFYIWCTLIADAVKSVDNIRPIISGLDNSDIERTAGNIKDISDMCDIHTTHPYHIFITASDPLATMKPILDLPFKCRISEDIGKIPTFIQEFGSIGYMNCSESTEADFYRAALMTSFAHGCHGVMWWCAFDQGHFDYAPYRWNSIGSNYGFFDKNGREKPIAQVNRAFKEELMSFGEKLPSHSVNGTIIAPRDDGDMDYDVLRASYMLAKQANLDMGFAYACDPIPDSPLYIFPSISGNKSIPKNRLDELLGKVENGAVLFMSADAGLMRSIPEMTGVTFAYREEINAEKTICLGDMRLPIKTRFFMMPESVNADIAAVDEDGNGVLFKNKYGKGYIYYLTLPLEKYLTQKQGAFFKENRQDYAAVYREAASAAKISRTADSDNPYIRLTEHVIDENSLYIFAINYNNVPETADLKLDASYSLSVIFGHTLSGHKLTLDRNDGILIKAVRKTE